MTNPAITDDILDLMTSDASDIASVEGEPDCYGTWKRLRDDSWGGRVVGRRPEPGMSILMARSDGSLSTHTVQSVNRTSAPNVFQVRVSEPVTAKPATARQAIPVVKSTPKPIVVKPAPVTGPEAFTTRALTAAAKRGDLIAGAAAEGNGILTGFQGRGPLTRATVLATMAEGGAPAEWAPAAKSAHAHAGRILNALNQLGYVCRADSKRRKGHDAPKDEQAELDQMVAADAKEAKQHYNADHLIRRSGGVPTYAARWEVAAGRGREAEVGSAFGTVVMIATLDANGELYLESDDVALTRRVREDFEARRNAEEFQAADISAWLSSILVSKFHAARVGGNWYVRREYAQGAERLLSAFARRWGQNWLLPALPIATTEQLCDGLASGLLGEAEAIYADFGKLASDGKLTSRRAEGLYADVKLIAVRAYGLQTVIGEERATHLATVQLAAFADNIAKQISKPLPPFASVARSMAPRR